MFQIFQSKTGARFVLSYLAIVLVVVVIDILAVVRLNQISASVDNLTNNLAADMALSKEMVNQVLLARFYANKYVRTQSQADLDRFHEEFAGLEALLGQAGQQITDPDRVDMLSRIMPAVDEYGDTFDRVAELIRKRQRIQSEVLDVQGLLIENKLTALRIHVVSLNEPLAFLALGNARNAVQLMRLNTARYLAEGDARYVVLFETGRQQAQTAFSGLETILQDSAQRENSTEAKAAAGAYYEGFQTIHVDYVELKDLFRTKLDVLEPEISNTASEVVTSIEREFEAQNEFSQVLISQTRLVLLVTTTIAVLTGLGLGVTVNRNITERERAAEALREAHDRLEIRVKERTAELRTANEQLQQEITERKRAEEIIKQMAYHDALTGLPNRRLFNDRLDVAMAHAHRNQQKLAVILFDLDHFKEVNDTLGHNVGDQLLQVVGERLTSLLRKEDTVARMGGDEFMLILTEVAEAGDADEVAQKILEAIRKPYVFDGHEIHVTTSIGIALYPDAGEDEDTLMKNADIAMYRAKDLGRDNYQHWRPTTQEQQP